MPHSTAHYTKPANLPMVHRKDFGRPAEADARDSTYSGEIKKQVSVSRQQGAQTHPQTGETERLGYLLDSSDLPRQSKELQEDLQILDGSGKLKDQKVAAGGDSVGVGNTIPLVLCMG